MQKFDNSHHSVFDTALIAGSKEDLNESDPFATNEELDDETCIDDEGCLGKAVSQHFCKLSNQRSIVLKQYCSTLYVKYCMHAPQNCEVSHTLASSLDCMYFTDE